MALFFFLVSADLGIDSPEIRELFLARIYELSNPTADEEDMEDDFLCECMCGVCVCVCVCVCVVCVCVLCVCVSVCVCVCVSE